MCGEWVHEEVVCFFFVTGEDGVAAGAGFGDAPGGVMVGIWKV